MVDYKQTDIGCIPKDWDVKKLGSILQSTQLGGNYPNTESITKYPLIKMGNLARGYIDLSKIEYVSNGIIPTYRDKLSYGNVIFNTRNTLDLVGKVSIWRDELQSAYFNSNIMRLKFKKQFVSSDFFINNIFNSKNLISQLRNIATGTTSVAAIYTRDLINIQIPLPPLKEQKAIAEVLSDTDALITTLEKRIAKKRNIKQGAMQKLLTPQDDWEVKKLGEIAEITSAGVDKKINPNETQVALLNYMDVYKRDYIFRNELNHNVTAPFSKKINCNVKKSDIFLLPSSETRTDIGTCAISMEDMDGVVYSYHIFRLRYLIDIDELFGMFMLKTQSFLNQSEMLCEGSGKRYVVSMNKFRSMEVYYPKLKTEQTRIATILSDMDSEIDLLEKKLSKTKELKQGLMQQLLTGKIRLV